MMRQRQLPTLICSTDPVSMPMDSLAGWIHHSIPPSPHKPAIMYYSPICQNDQAIKEQSSLVFFTPINFSLEQNILVVSRQAFILY